LPELTGYLVTKLLDPPPQGDYDLVLRTLSLLDEKEYSALTALLPIFHALKDGTYGWNNTQHPSPTIDEALAQIQGSRLSDQRKKTLLAIIRRNQVSSKGVPFFLPSNTPTEARDLEDWIQQLKASAAQLDPLIHRV
jgi:hypothetical protein